MKIENDYFSKYILTLISPDGSIINVEKDSSELNHWEPYTRLNLKVKLLNKIDPDIHSSRNLPNIFAKAGYINFYPFCLVDDGFFLYADWILLIFPFAPTANQLHTLQSFYTALNNRDVSFFDKPTFEPELQFDDLINGLPNLKQFVVEKESNLLSKIVNER